MQTATPRNELNPSGRCAIKSTRIGPAREFGWVRMGAEAKQLISNARASGLGKLNNERVGIVIQARMGSSRLPGKVLKEIQGEPLLGRLCQRVRLSRQADVIGVATSDRPGDEPISDACLEWGIPVFRGSETDVLARFLGAAKAWNLTAVVRVTADNPLTDPSGIDELIRQYKETAADVVHNNHRRGYPCGTGAELVRLSVLEQSHHHSVSAVDREHVTSFARRNPQRFSCVKINAEEEFFRPHYFLTVDYAEDLSLLRKIYAHFGGRDDTRLSDIVNFLDLQPALVRLNAGLHQELSE